MKAYIGHSLRIEKRWHNHKYRLRKNTHISPHLQAAWNKHGANSFKFYVLEFISKSELVEREQFWLNKVKPFNNIGYNLAPKAGSTLGIKASEEHRLKNSKAQKGKMISVETREKIKISLKGRKQSFEHRNKRRIAQLGRVTSEQTRIKISISLKKYHAKP